MDILEGSMPDSYDDVHFVPSQLDHFRRVFYSPDRLGPAELASGLFFVGSVLLAAIEAIPQGRDHFLFHTPEKG